MTMRKEQVESLRARLEAERERLTGEIEGLQQSVIQYSESVADEDRSYGNHMADDATNTYEQERQLALQRTLQTVLVDVESAIQRMNQGLYGVCEVCGEEIPIERLEARPYSTRCVADQEKEDRRR